MEKAIALNEHKTAELIGRSVQTLRNWRSLRRGPAYCKTGRSISYRREDIEAYLMANRIDPEEAPQ